jgi:gliding motility-associated-like protein
VNSAGCTAALDTLVFFAPLPEVFAGDDVETDCSAGVLLNAQSDGTSFLWQPSTTLSNDTLLQPLANPTQSTLYTVVATLGNCTATDQVFVKADCSAVYVPSSFTPDYDGVNDYFQVIARGLSKFEIVIFDRWGEPVFKSTDVNEKWQGDKDAYFVPDGIYTYRLTALDERGIPVLGDEITFGHIIVLR